MGDPGLCEMDGDVWAKAAQRYARLKRRAWRFTRNGLVVWLITMLAFAVQPSLKPAVGQPIALICWGGCFICWVGAALTWSALREFRCPRCRQRFLVSWSNTLPTSSCKHCGLNLKLG